MHAHQPLQFELMHNLVLELTRASIEVKNLKMRVESVQSRLEFNERRARALEAVVQYRPDAAPGGRGGRDEGRRDTRGESPRGPQGQPRAPQPQAQAQPRPPQQQRSRRARPSVLRCRRPRPRWPWSNRRHPEPSRRAGSIRSRAATACARGAGGGGAADELGEGDAGASGTASAATDDSGEDAGLKPGRYDDGPRKRRLHATTSLGHAPDRSRER